MASNNPFERLKVKQDPEDQEEDDFKEVKGKKGDVPFGIEPKKKKIRPQEKKEEEDEGFEEVGKRHRGEGGDEAADPQHKKRKGFNYGTKNKDRLEDNKPSRGRKYDRRSGTAGNHRTVFQKSVIRVQSWMQFSSVWRV